MWSDPFHRARLAFPGIVAVIVFAFTLTASEYTVLVAVPIAIVFNLFLDRFVAGFTQGAVKG